MGVGLVDSQGQKVMCFVFPCIGDREVLSTGIGRDRAILERAVAHYFAGGLAENTSRTYASAIRRYESFCSQLGIPPLPLAENKSCLFAAHLAREGLSAQSITSYLAAIRYMQIAAGLGAPPTEHWPRLHYTVRGIKRLQPSSPRRVRLPITPAILMRLCRVWMTGQVESPYNARLLWAACCLGYFGFMRAGEFTAVSVSTQSSICLSDVSVDSRRSPAVLCVHLRKAKTDPFGKGIDIFLGKTGQPLCPVTALLNFLLVRQAGEGPLLVLQDGTPLSRDLFIRKVRKALTLAQVDQRLYAGHSFRIGAATTAAAVGIPTHIIKMLGRWNSEAYLLYIRQPREALASVSARIAAAP